MSEWIKCSQKMPPLGEIVIIAARDMEAVVKVVHIEKAVCNGNGFIVLAGSVDLPREWVTHWMPLPEPPKD